MKIAQRRDDREAHRSVDGQSDAREKSGARRIARPAAPAPSTPRNRRTAPREGTTSSPSLPAPAAPRVSMKQRFTGLRTKLGARLERLRKPATILFRIIVVALAIVAAVALFRVVEQHVRTSPAFATSEIELEGASRLTRADVEAAAGIAVGRNVFERSPDEARAALLAHPWIAEAEVRRRLPGRWSIAIRERSAAAILMLEEAWLVDAEGAVFKRAEAGDPIDLPVITGIERERFTTDRAFRTRVLLGIVALLSDWRAAGLWRREPIGEIHVEPDDALTLRIGDDATEVRLGHGPYRAKLDRLRRVLDELGQRQARPAYVYLDNVRRPDRVTVRVR
ncbi:cell division protein FtsQ/DivIB [Sandaracinus amylolyticus]|uniref:cell division protein FtsQ/DivIB n=1 Tax=Sandaracinus amylolyticus TaxID=927083 RepID=UPI001F356761|nr:FtsQ-type POTRA domain-containing protein [Sandaracinus amylolyticus]UJR78949.1 Cell division protein FtsQ [Sandaracinus amylolyticus]